ncbi:4-(cytidine 5'-diphospho)-2-C-methyl-D-erythritol kinase [bacterium]|nr:4-(cytidine 5'-diphospho)-2-C-methyl-D-erythritol kinase [bacterium]MBU1614132.1 4-(cytidine 5'-diphospho)-2-C-methyl-D-erythritol kinase [bacterium]
MKKNPKLEILAPAKVNLFLEVKRKFSSGYHEIETVMQSIGLYDTLTFSLAKDVSLDCRYPGIPQDKNNLVVKAALLLKSCFKIEQGARITLLKKIPPGSGLAGASTDAAATLWGLNKLWQLGLSKEELTRIGKELGADVPFCLTGKTALAGGIGEIIKPLPSLVLTYFVLVCPGIEVSTAFIYKSFKLTNRLKSSNNMVLALKEKDGRKAGTLLFNRLEETTFEHYPFLSLLKQKLIDAGASSALMSGSGGTLFGIAKSKEQAKEIIKKLRQEIREPVYLVKSISSNRPQVRYL